jgi:hypothetical protein
MTPLTSFLASSFLVAICSINCDFVICVAIVAPLIREAASIDDESMKIRDFRHCRWAATVLASLEYADSCGVALRAGLSAALKPRELRVFTLRASIPDEGCGARRRRYLPLRLRTHRF